jgi:NADH-quinone oxidoreductase subunit F
MGFLTPINEPSSRPLTGHNRADGRPLSISEYESVGGYHALRQALDDMTPAEVVKAVKDANLLGRGGAGFPTGLKWSFVPMGESAPRPKTIIANADEMEPGTFKDRALMEANPHQLIEGMLLAAFAVEAERGFIFLRWAYQNVADILIAALAEARASGYLGRNALGAGKDFDVHLHVSAGRYMCGEETGLLNAMEGKRAIPRAKPPYPQVVGLWGKPTVVQNVETLCNIPHIVRHGAEWFKSLSLTDDSGTKIYGASGKVARPGVWELAMGTHLRTIIDEYAGGMRLGFTLRAVIPGGASTEFILAEHLDMPMDFSSVKRLGSRLGTGTMIVLDDKTCPVGLVLNLERFFARESCGLCTPCREGLPWVAKLLEGIEAGQGCSNDLDILLDHTKRLGPGRTFCALAPGAMEPLQSALKYFREDFERHISEKCCPYSRKSGA